MAEKIKNVKKSIYFKSLDEMDFNALMRCMESKLRAFKPGEEIVSIGDSVNDAFIIISGYTRAYSIDDEGNILLRLDYSKNNIFGVKEISQNLKYYDESLVALEETLVLTMSKYRFLNPCENRCKRHIELMKLASLELARQTSAYINRIDYMSKGKTKAKVLAYLNHMVKTKKSKDIFIPYSRQQLADYLGVERTALSAELSKLKKDNLIDYDKNNFIIKY